MARSRPDAPGVRSRRHQRVRRAIAPVAIIGALLASLFATAVLAVHDEGLFEVGPGPGGTEAGITNILAHDDDAGPDWGSIFNANRAVVGLGDGIAAAFLADDLAQKNLTDKSTFSGAGGSNKNNDFINDEDAGVVNGDTWHWDTGSGLPPKDDLANVYAYAAIDDKDTVATADDDLIFYAGLERLNPDGDAYIDIEFLQAKTGLDEAIPCNDPGQDTIPCHFTGTGRTVNDMIVSMNFSNGGAIGAIEVRRWNGTEYILEEALVGEGCTGDELLCGFNNAAGIDGGPWLNYNSQNQVITTLEANAFTEFGVNVTDVIEGDPCVTTVMAKTRSSTSFTSELKDFAGPVPFEICGANIGIEQSATNEVDDEHTFTVTVNKSLGSSESPAPNGTIVDVDLTPTPTDLDFEVIDDTCADPGTVDGECTVTVNSSEGGKIVAHASATLNVGGQDITVETDGKGDNSGDATKTYVDANIVIDPPTDTNSVGEAHTFTVTVKKDTGTGTLEAATDGHVDVTLTGLTGVTTNGGTSTCDDAGDNLDGNGQCTLVIGSASAGTVTANASVSLSVGGLTLTRDTDSATTTVGAGPGGSGAATKTFVAGSLVWTKVDHLNAKQGGATFEVCRTHDFVSATVTFSDITDVCVSIADDIVGPGVGTPTTSTDQDPDPGEFSLTGLRLGRYTVRETVAPAGFAADGDTESKDLTILAPNGTISMSFVNNRPILKLTGFGYTNEPSGTVTNGIVTGRTVYTVSIKNYGLATATTLDFDLDISSIKTQGTVDCRLSLTVDDADCNLVIDGTLAPGATTTVTYVIDYTGLNDGATISADLTGTYSLNNLTRDASGIPADITFTVQAD